MNQKVKRVLEEKDVVEYLKTRGLVNQYKKAKSYLLAGLNGNVRFKQRNPKGSGVWYFRISRKFRALGYFSISGDFIVVDIDDHQ